MCPYPHTSLTLHSLFTHSCPIQVNIWSLSAGLCVRHISSSVRPLAASGLLDTSVHRGEHSWTRAKVTSLHWVNEHTDDSLLMVLLYCAAQLATLAFL